MAEILDKFISERLKNVKNGELGVWNDVISSRVNSDLVIYGASRAWVHFDTKILSDSLGVSTYNLGIDGHNFYLQYLRHRLLFKFNRKPKLVAHAIDIYTLQKREDLYQPEQFLPHMFDHTMIQRAISTYKGYSYFDFRIPLIRYYGRLLRSPIRDYLFNSSLPPDRWRGFRGQDLHWNSDFEQAKDNLGSFVVKLDEASVQSFDEYLGEMKMQGIRVVLVNPPEYIEGQWLVQNREEIFDLYRKLADKHGLSFLDFSSDPISFEKKYFYNSMHLNKSGAESFTRKFIESLKASGDDIAYLY